MSAAPTDGTRVIIRVKCYHYMGRTQGYSHKGYAWTEGRFIEGQWEEWCGTERVRSSRRCDPVAWMHVPYMEEG